MSMKKISNIKKYKDPEKKIHILTSILSYMNLKEEEKDTVDENIFATIQMRNIFVTL